MKHTTLTLAAAAAALGATLLAPSLVSAQTYDIFTEDLTAFNSSLQVGDGTTYGITVLDSGGPFGTGNYVRFFDLSTSSKPEAQGEVGTVIDGPFNVVFQSVNQSVSTNDSPAIRWRMANSGKSISSGNRSAFSLSWHSDLTFSASYLTDSNTVSSIETAPQSGAVYDVYVVGNGSTNETYSYQHLGASRTLDPLSYDVYVDDALLNSAPEFTGGLGFSAGVATEYIPEDGLKRFGLIGSSGSDQDPDVLFDNIVLTVGEVAVEQPMTLGQRALVEGLQFSSDAGVVYLLQFSTDPNAAAPIWEHAGIEVTGNGGDMMLFDPTGYDSNKTYRVVEAP